MDELEISIGRAPDLEALIGLFAEAGWSDKSDPARLATMIADSSLVVTAWQGNRMVGFARCLTDHAFNAQINNVVVDRGFRRRGIGRALVQALLGAGDEVTYILRADPENAGFYERLGFERADLAMVYRRKR